MPYLADLEELVLKCRNDASRGHIQEALSCYRAQAYRSSIVSTWIAVVYDFVDKLRDLSIMGDVNAQRRLREFETICQSHDVAKSLVFERHILHMAKDEFELLSELEYDELSRLLNDRHKCAHPSMHDAMEPYRPTAEAARYHLRNAVDLFLQHPPAQGKAALDRLTSDLDRPFYPDSLADLETHLAGGHLARPRKSLLRNFVLVLLKDLFAPQPDSAMTSAVDLMLHQLQRSRREKRITLTLAALHQLQGEAVLDAMAERLDQLLAAADDSKLPLALQLFSSIPESWRSVGQAQRNREIRFVQQMPVESLNPHLRLAWNLGFLRPAAEERLHALVTRDWQQLGEGPFPDEWLETALNSLDNSTSFNLSNAIIRGVLMPGIEQLSIQNIDRIIRAARANVQVLGAFALNELLSSAVVTGAIGLNPVVDSLRDNALLDEFRNRVPWIPTQV